MTRASSSRDATVRSVGAGPAPTLRTVASRDEEARVIAEEVRATTARPVLVPGRRRGRARAVGAEGAVLALRGDDQGQRSMFDRQGNSLGDARARAKNTIS